VGSPSGLLASTTWVTDVHDPQIRLSVPTSQTVEERRRYRRVPLETTVAWRSWMWDRETWGSAGAVDVSLGGICIAVGEGTPRPPQVGDVIDLRVPLGDADDVVMGAVQTRGLVVGAEATDGGVTCRVAFSSLDDVASRRLSRYCAPVAT
jgi:c-di-GMP-binding flagellar brake protein YcgR